MLVLKDPRLDWADLRHVQSNVGYIAHAADIYQRRAQIIEELTVKGVRAEMQATEALRRRRGEEFLASHAQKKTKSSSA